MYRYVILYICIYTYAHTHTHIYIYIIILVRAVLRLFLSLVDRAMRPRTWRHPGHGEPAQRGDGSAVEALPAQAEPRVGPPPGTAGTTVMTWSIHYYGHRRCAHIKTNKQKHV